VRKLPDSHVRFFSVALCSLLLGAPDSEEGVASSGLSPQMQKREPRRRPVLVFACKVLSSRYAPSENAFGRRRRRPEASKGGVSSGLVLQLVREWPVRSPHGAESIAPARSSATSSARSFRAQRASRRALARHIARGFFGQKGWSSFPPLPGSCPSSPRIPVCSALVSNSGEKAPKNTQWVWSSSFLLLLLRSSWEILRPQPLF
jgi:hypothetical protein